MLVNIIYGIIVLIATTIGSIAGIGGGVIIKPAFDTLGIHNPTTISFYSSIAVFTMALISILKLLKTGVVLKKEIILPISFGSIIGGILGERLFNYILKNLKNINDIKVIQSSLLLFSLFLILFYTLNKHKIKTFNLKNKFWIFFIGMCLGCISIFLGIGGGPLNIALMTIFFSYEAKEAAVYSIATIFFSQCSKLIDISLKGNFLEFDLLPLPFICIFAIIGGFIGTNLNRKFDSKKIERIYIITIFCLSSLCVVNILS